GSGRSPPPRLRDRGDVPERSLRAVEERNSAVRMQRLPGLTALLAVLAALPTDRGHAPARGRTDPPATRSARRPPARVPQDGSFRITRTDGSAITGRLVGLDGDTLAVEDPDGERVQVPFDDVLALAGPPPTPAGAVRVLLVGGDELTGDLVGGDAAGETFRVRSGALGPVDVVVDRLRRIEFVARAEAAGPRSFEV